MYHMLIGNDAKAALEVLKLFTSLVGINLVKTETGLKILPLMFHSNSQIRKEGYRLAWSLTALGSEI